jgi:hypothetical protein
MTFTLAPLPGSPEGDRLRRRSIGNIDPIALSCSSTHFLLLSRARKLYSFGSNSANQITSRDVRDVSDPIECDWSATLSIREFAAGTDFTVVITESGEVVTRGQRNQTTSWKAPRGLSAYGARYAFAFEGQYVCIGAMGDEPVIVEVPDPIVLTAIHDRYLAAVSASGTVYVIDRDGRLVDFGLRERVKGASVSPRCFVFMTFGAEIFVVDVEFLTVDSKSLPSGFVAADVLAVPEQVIALSETGELAFSRQGSGNLTTDWVPAFTIPPRVSIAFLTHHRNCAVFVKGRPGPRAFVAQRCQFESGQFVEAVDDNFVCASSEFVYFENHTYPTSQLSDVIFVSDNEFLTAAGRTVRVDKDGRRLFEQNFCRGDRIEIRCEKGPLSAQIAGFADGAVWVLTSGSSDVVALPPLPPAQLSERIISLVRPDHTVSKVAVDNDNLWVDTTPSFCALFGYEPGDLVFVDVRGTVEFFGVFAGDLLFLDLSARTLFFLPPLPYKLLRRASTRLPHTQTVITTDGTVVDLDVSSDGPRIFLPTDRVLSPFGEATVVGFAKVPYIQTDEMRMNGYEAAPSDIFKLSLLRRISRRAVRAFEVSGEQTSVSLNTEDSIDGLFPGDSIFMDARYGKVVGFRGKDVVVRFAGETDCQIAKGVPEIVYRADIQAVRNCPDFPGLRVGSPAIPETTVLPGDFVDANTIGECEFLGYSDKHTIFVSTETKEAFALTFGLLLYPGFFTVKKRNGLIEIKD